MLSLSAAYKLGALAVLITSSAYLAGCVATDVYGGRASAFNEQAAVAKRNVVLANITRSAYSLPLQFTDISTVTGQTAAQASIGSSLPFFLKGDGNLMGSVSPGAQISGNAQFGVANLNNQEFYNGLQAPISKQLLAFYLRSGFPARVLLPLVISEIEIVNSGRRTRIINSPLQPNGFRNFNSVMQILIAKGLNVEQSSSSAPLGPVLTSSQAADPRIQAQIIAAGADAPSLEKVAGGYQLRRGSKGYAFCFDPLVFQGPGVYADDGVLTGPSVVGGGDLSISLLTASQKDPANTGTRVVVDPSHFCSNKGFVAPSDDRNARQKAGLNLIITTRSVEQIFTYLGEIVRVELGLGGTAPTSLELHDFDRRAYRLFSLRKGAGGPGYITATLDGQWYSVRVDPSGRDESGRVLQLLTDLLALQSSAKTLPATNVISVINQ